MTILSHSFDQNLGGRDFDEVLFRHFASEFKEQYNIDVYSNSRASIRLRVSCEKLKKVPSANANAPLSIECLIDDKDLNGFITREEFEYLSLELLERVTHACCKALNDTGLSIDEIDTIELVGSGSRIPAIMRMLTSLFGKPPMRTLNGSECVARGCALRCAMLSPTFHVEDYKFQDIFPYSIGLLRSIHGESKRYPEFMFSPKGCQFPSDNMFPYDGNNTYYFQVLYTNNDELPAGILPIVGNFMVGGAKRVTGIVKLNLNIHGIVEIEFISDQKARRGRARRRNLLFPENLEVAMTKDEIHEAQEREKILADQDIKVEQIKEKGNTLESFIYDTRSKLLNSYRSMATDSEAEEISKNLQETEEWLYEEDDDESEQVYIGKLKDLKKLLSPIENRYKDENARKEAIKALRKCIEENRVAADLLPPSQKEEVNNECIQAEQWLNSLSQLQDSLAKNATPIYYSSAIIGVTQVFMRRCKEIRRSKPSFQNYNNRKHNPDDIQVDKDVDLFRLVESNT